MSFTGQNYDKSWNIPQVSENTQSYTKNLKQVPPKMSMQVSSSGEKFMNITLLHSEFFWKQLLSLNSALWWKIPVFFGREDALDQLWGHFIGQTVLTERKFQILGSKEIFQFSKFPWVLLEPVFSMSLIAD